MKTWIRILYYQILSFINKFIPKKNKIVIYGGEFLDDNSEAMFRYLNDKTDYEVVCICNKSLKYKSRENVRIIKNTYRNAFIELSTSRVLIDSSFHTVKMKPTKNQLFIQCWHGSPLKSMNDPANNGKYYSIFFYASDFFKSYLQEYFHTTKDNMICLGGPRNDYLFEPQINNYRCEEYAGYKYRVIWMPTFRQGLGRTESNVDIPILNATIISELDERLKELDIALIIKPHRVQIGSFEHLLSKYNPTNISIISDEYFIKHNIPLYSFVANMDALLTDYSSIYFDFLLLNKPIGFAIDDIEQYSFNRGFAFTNPLELMPGKKIKSIKELISFFEDIAMNNDAYRSERTKMCSTFNHFLDGENCQRCKELIDAFME